MSKKEATNIIWEDIYLNPKKYGLLLHGDQKSDFLLYLQERMESLFDEYQPGKILFRTFIWGLVKHTFLTWRRKIKKLYENEEATRKSLMSLYNEMCDAYCEPDQEIISENSDENIKEDWHKKEREMAEKATLILALKSCYDIDEKLIDSVSRFTHIKKERLFEKIDKMKEKSEHKISRRNAIIRSRDNAFYFHRKYLIELSKLKQGTSTFERVQKKYQQQTNRWIRQNQLLTHRFVLSPSNVDIADELGMKPRQVCFYINHIRQRRTHFHELLNEKQQEKGDAPDEDIRQQTKEGD
ncbi:MAG: hypothetical protein IJS09_09785 [Treponema sp.]|nr:hypothetical protein [Treponema sp.]